MKLYTRATIALSIALTMIPSLSFASDSGEQSEGISIWENPLVQIGTVGIVSGTSSCATWGLAGKRVAKPTAVFVYELGRKIGPRTAKVGGLVTIAAALTGSLAVGLATGEAAYRGIKIKAKNAKQARQQAILNRFNGLNSSNR